MKTQLKKRCLSFALAAVLVLGLWPAQIYAMEEDTPSLPSASSLPEEQVHSGSEVDPAESTESEPPAESGNAVAGGEEEDAPPSQPQESGSSSEQSAQSYGAGQAAQSGSGEDDTAAAEASKQGSSTDRPGVLMMAGTVVIGTGSEQSPLEITSRAVFQEIVEYYNAGSLHGFLNISDPDALLHFRLAADIDLSGLGNGWVPFGNADRPFNGVFDGAGHTITGLGVAASIEAAGLFGWIGEDGTVQNLALQGCNINGAQYSGGIAGRSMGRIVNCAVDGYVSGEDSAGGICGNMYVNAVIENCLFTGSVYSSGGYAGGLCGVAVGAAGGGRHSVLRGSASLAQSVYGYLRSGRLVGAPPEGDTAPIVEDCLSWSGTGTQNNAALHDAYSSAKTAAELRGQSVWPAALRQAPWAYEEGLVPSLGGQAAAFPAYLYIMLGAGTQGDPYRITGWEGLVFFADTVSAANTYAGKYVRVEGPIAVPEGQTFAGINGFAGTFDGGHHEITGLTMNMGGIAGVGMFRNTGAGATIQNVVLVNADITGYTSVGGIVGVGTGTTITGCYVSGSITARHKDVAGIIGAGYGCTVQSCYSVATVSGSYGVAGIQTYMEGGLVEDCYAGGLLVSYYAGSVAGVVAHPETDTCVIRRCYSTSAIQVNGPTLSSIHSGTGGVIGVTSGYGEDLVAINQSVGDVNGTYSPVTGRYLSDAATHQGQAYWAMIPGNDMPDIHNDRNAYPYSARQLQENTNGIWDAFAAQAWSYSPGGLPILQGLPAYLQSDAWPEWLADNYEDMYEHPTMTVQPSGYIIRNAKQLAWLSQQSTGVLDGKTIQFAADISLVDYNAGIGWTPIGSYNDPPTLIIEGHGHIISDMSIRYQQSEPTALGLFGRLAAGSSLVNLHVENASIESANTRGDDYIGGLVGRATYTNISYCSFDGVIRVLTNGGNVGGIVGRLDGDPAGRPQTVDGCAVRGSIESGASGDVGGIAGFIAQSDRYPGGTTLQQCYNLAEIRKGKYAGGLVGNWNIESHEIFLYSAADITLITSCYNRGTVQGSGAVGGLVGRIYYEHSRTNAAQNELIQVRIVNSYNSGLVQGDILPATTQRISGKVGGLLGTFQTSYTNSGTNPYARTQFWLSGCSLGPAVLGIAYAPGESQYPATVQSDPILGGIEEGASPNPTDTTVINNGNRMWRSQVVTENGATVPSSDYWSTYIPLSSTDIVADRALANFFGSFPWSYYWDVSTIMPTLKNAARPEWQTGAAPGHMSDGGTGGSQDTTIEIRTPADLSNAMQRYNGGSNTTYQLMNDIDMAGETGFGSFSSFAGTFNGNGYTIYNMAMGDADSNNVGMFASIQPGGVVRNLALVDCTATGGTRVGLLAGVNQGTITGCYAARSTAALVAQPDAVQVTARSDAGGLVGRLVAGGTLQDSYAAVNVHTMGDLGYERNLGAGGLVGTVGYDVTNYGSEPIRIERCFAVATVSSTQNNAGGLYGRVIANNQEGANRITLRDCYAIPAGVTPGTYGTSGQVAGYISYPTGVFENQTAWRGLTATDGPVNATDGTAWLAAEELGEQMNSTLGATDGWQRRAGATPILSSMKGEQYNYLPLEQEAGLGTDGLKQDENGVYLLYSARDLVLMGQLLATGGAYQNAAYRVMADIDLADVVSAGDPWAPMEGFGGDFDGGGHTITLADSFAPGIYGGLFGTVGAGATLRDVTLYGNIGSNSFYKMDSGAVTYVGSRFGLLAAVLHGSAENITAEGQILAEAQYVGGIVGQLASGGSIQNSVNRATILVSGLNTADWSALPTAGGIAGASDGDITGCANEAPVTSFSASPEGIAGGIVGMQHSGSIEGSRNAGMVTGYSAAGGIAGMAFGSISCCFSTIHVTAAITAGGVAGQLGGSIHNSYTLGAITAGTGINAGTAGGIAGNVDSGGAINHSYSAATVVVENIVVVVQGGIVSPGGAGGIAGSGFNGQPNYIDAVVALNYRVSANEAGYHNRVMGYERDGNGNPATATQVGSSYAYESMGLEGLAPGTSGAEGAPISKQQIWSRAFWANEAGFDMETIWQMPTGNTDNAKLPTLRGLDGQDGTLPLYLQEIERGENATLALQAAMAELLYSNNERTVVLTATLENSESNQRELSWSVDAAARAAGVTVTPADGNSHQAALAVPGGYVGGITVTVAHSTALTLRDSVTVVALPLDPPTGLTATYGDALSQVALPTGWAWKTPDDLVGDAGTTRHMAVFNIEVDAELEVAVAVRPITVKADDKSKYLGQADPAFTWSVTEGSLLGDDTLTGRLGYTGSGVGTHDIVAVEPLENPNYAVTFQKGVMTILALPSGLMATYGDMLASVALPIGWAWKTPADPVGDAGTNSHSASTDMGDVLPLEVEVQPRPITVKADDKSKYLGQADPTFTWSVTEGSLLGSDTLTGRLGYTGSGVGTHDIVAVEPLENPNYAVTFQKGVMTILALPSGLTATYGDTLESVALPIGWAWETPADPVGDAGTNSHSGIADTGDVLTLEVEVQPRPITVKADDKSKYLGQADPIFTWSVTEGSLLGGDTLTGRLGYTGSGVGTHDIVAVEPLENPNYAVTFQKGVMTILALPSGLTATYGDTLESVALPIGWAWQTPDDLVGDAGTNSHSAIVDAADVLTLEVAVQHRPITVKADDKSKYLGQEDPAFTWSVTEGSLLAGDTLTGKLGYTGSGVGTHDIVAVEPLENPNYAVTFQKGVMTILALPSGLTATYGDTLASVALPTGWAWQTPDDLVGDAGTNSHSAIVDAANVLTLEVAVQHRPITVKADDKSKYLGQEDPAFTWSVTEGSLLAGDTLTGRLGYDGNAVGEYAIIALEQLANPNYDITFEPGIMKVLPNPSVEEVTRLIEALPQPVKTWADADKVAEATNVYNGMATADRQLLAQSILDRLHAAQSEAGPVNQRHGVSASVDASALEWYVRLTVSRVAEEESIFSAIAALTQSKELLALYDISLVNTLTGDAFHLPAGNTVSLCLNEVPVTGRTGVAVLHVLAPSTGNYTLEELQCQVSGQTIQFNTGSLSLFAVTANQKESNNTESSLKPESSSSPVAPTGDGSTHWYWLVMLMTAALCFAALLYIRWWRGKRKQH